MQGIALTAASARCPGAARARAARARLVKGSTGGPDAAARARASHVVAGRWDAGGERLAQVRLEGVDAYDFTGADPRLAAERPPPAALQGTGALGPVDGFGLDGAEAGTAESGIARAG